LTFRKFFYNGIFLSLFFMGLVAAFNLYLNPYGIFGNMKGRAVTIYNNERTSKYLLSFNYIPSNFDGVLIGPSVSDNLDTRDLLPYRVYNASLNGGNIMGLARITKNLIQKGKLNFLIICLSPYITKDHKIKTSHMVSEEILGSLGSLESIKYYIHRIKVWQGMEPMRWNAYGAYDYYLGESKIPVKDIRARILRQYPEDMKIAPDDLALEELKNLIQLARQHNIKIFGYYYPYLYDRYVQFETDYKEYQKRINRLFSDGDIIWDFNTETYRDFRSDYSNYGDHTHLSDKGAGFILAEIKKKLDAHLHGG